MKVTFEVDITPEMIRALRTMWKQVDPVTSEDIVKTLPEAAQKVVRDLDLTVKRVEPLSRRDITKEDLRAALDDARTRIEGSGWEQNKAARQELHPVITAWVKYTALLLGNVARPTELDNDRRAKFVEMCNALTLAEIESYELVGGQLINKQAPY